MQLKKFNTHSFIIIVIITNYYFLVLLFAAERLKFAVLFALLYILIYKARHSYLFILLSVLSHVQTLIIYLAYIFKELMISSRKVNYYLLVLLLFIIGFSIGGTYL